MYDSTKAQDHGDVTTLSRATNAIDLGNANIQGTAHTGPGGKVKLGSTGVVGDRAFVASGTHNGMIQAGHEMHDAIQVFPDATLPDTGGKLWTRPLAGNTTIGGVTYKYM